MIMNIKLQELVVEKNHNREYYPNNWVARVFVEKPLLFGYNMEKHQSVIAFPAISDFGIGFYIENYDSNTHLPYQVSTEAIYEHIKVNWPTGDKQIVCTAINMLKTYLKTLNPKHY